MCQQGKSTLFSLHRSIDQLLKRREINVGQTLDIQAAFSRTMLPEFRQQIRITLIAGANVQSQILPARRKRKQGPIRLLATGVFDRPGAEANDARAPDDRLAAGRSFHEPGDRQTVCARLRIIETLYEIVKTLLCWFCFRFSHFVLS